LICVCQKKEDPIKKGSSSQKKRGPGKKGEIKKTRITRTEKCAVKMQGGCAATLRGARKATAPPAKNHLGRPPVQKRGNTSRRKE